MKPHWKEAAWQLRTAFVGIAVTTVVVLAVLAIRGDSETVTAWVNERDISEGQTVADSGPIPVSLPPGALPASALTNPNDVSQARFALPLEAGTVLTEKQLLGSPLSRNLGSDEVVITLPIPPSPARALQVGDSIDLWGTSPDCVEVACAPSLLAEAARIVDITQYDGTDWGETDHTGVTVILNREHVGAALGAASHDALHCVLRQPQDLEG